MVKIEILMFVVYPEGCSHLLFYVFGLFEMTVL